MTTALFSFFIFSLFLFILRIVLFKHYLKYIQIKCAGQESLYQHLSIRSCRIIYSNLYCVRLSLASHILLRIIEILYAYRRKYVGILAVYHQAV